MNFYTNTNSEPVIIGIDHGYGNIKTARTCFKTGVAAYDKEPTFKSNLLIYEDRFYLIGEDHKEFLADKIMDEDYYILTLAAIGRELNIRQIPSARVHLAVGLPLTWVSEQKDEFRAYLLKNETADFNFRGKDYHVEFAGADVFPQGFSAVADRLRDFKGVNMLCDIGNGTSSAQTSYPSPRRRRQVSSIPLRLLSPQNLRFCGDPVFVYINNGKPVPSKCFTEKYGTHQCMLAVRENLMQRFGTAVDDSVIENVLRFGTADIGEKYLAVICSTATEYVSGIMRRLREHEYSPELMRLYVMGGGSCLVRNFGEYDKDRVTINDDICATAKGYEALAAHSLRKAGDPA